MPIPNLKKSVQPVSRSYYYPKPTVIKDWMNELIKLDEKGLISKTHDYLDTKSIPGASPDTYGRLKNINGRDYINTNDIEGA